MVKLVVCKHLKACGGRVNLSHPDLLVAFSFQDVLLKLYLVGQDLTSEKLLYRLS